MKEGKLLVYICPTCGNQQTQIFSQYPVKCKAAECSSDLFEVMIEAIQIWDQQIRKFLTLKEEENVDLNDLKAFCSAIFEVDRIEYEDFRAITQTLIKLKTLTYDQIVHIFR